MPRKDRLDTPTVRHNEQSAVQAGLPCVRVKVRIDYWPLSGELDFSLVAWETPEARLVSNRVWATYDDAHIGMAPLDITASIYDALDLVPAPFP